MAYALALQNASFVLDNGQPLFHSIHFSVKHRVNALVGVNGVGKSVLAQILAKRLALSSGAIHTTLTCAYVPQQWHGNLNDNLLTILGLSDALAAMKRISENSAQLDDYELAEPWWDWQKQLATVFQACGLDQSIDLARPISSFSGGEQFRLCWAAARLQKADAYIFDEPTNHLDTQGKQQLLAWIKTSSKCFILVSHDREFLANVNAIYELTPQHLYYHPGNYECYFAAKQQRWQLQQQAVNTTRKAEKRAASKAQEALEKQQQRVANGKAKAARENWSVLERNGAKQAGEANLKQQKTMRNLRNQAANSARESAELAKEWFDPIGFTLPNSFVPATKMVLSFNEFSAGYSQALHPPITALLSGAFRLHISGDNGAGKSALIKALLGQEPAFCGSAAVKVPTAYLDQHVGLFTGTLSAVENLLHHQPTLSENEARDRLAWLRLRNTKADVAFAALSGGEQLKVALACKLLGKQTPQLLILDEPTNHLDLDSIIALEKALQQFQGAMIIISHDQRFIANQTLTHRLHLSRAELVSL